MLRGLSSSPRAPATDEVRQHFVRLRQAKAPSDFIGNDAADALGLFSSTDRKSEDVMYLVGSANVRSVFSLLIR